MTALNPLPIAAIARSRSQVFNDARPTLERAVARSEAAGRLAEIEVVRVHDERIVARAKLDGEACFLKVFLHDRGAEIVAATAAELATVSDHFGDGPHRITRCLLADPKGSVIVTSAVPGVSLRQILKSAPREVAEETLFMVGQWMAAYGSRRRIERVFKTADFDRQRKALLAKPFMQTCPRDAVFLRVERQILERAAALDGQPIRVAATHGDLSPENLHRAGDNIYGFDVDDFCTRPVAIDVAKFIVHVQAGTRLEDDTVFGVSKWIHEAMRASGVLPEIEWETVLPLYISHQIERRHACATSPHVRGRLLGMAERFLRDIH